MTELSKQEVRILINKVSRSLQNNQLDEARYVFSTFAEHSTDDVELLLQLGSLSSSLGDNLRAVDFFTAALEQQPDNPQNMYYLAQAHTNVGNNEKARELLLSAIELNPDNHGPYLQLAMGQFNERRYSEALELLEKAMALKPSEPQIYLYLVYTLRELMRHDDALDYADKFIRLQPGGNSYVAKSRLLSEMGQTDEAATLLEKAIRSDRKCGIAYYELASIKKFSEQDESFINNTEQVLQQTLPTFDRSNIHYSLGKMYDDCKQWDRAIEHYKQANVISRVAIEPDAQNKRFKHVIKKIFNKKFFNRTTGFGSNSETPVFIVGMPRSGTTLLEQIIASHPEGAGAGEMAEISRLEHLIIPGHKMTDRELLQQLDKDRTRELADKYLEVLCENRTDAKRIVDKMPDNFLHLGFIYLLFPNARVIHARRNPLDTCLSCYFQAFDKIDYTNDLEWLARRYRFYREVMDYWYKTLPDGYIVDMQYEDIVQDPEFHIRQLIDICGLPWNDLCLEFYATDRAISTRSLWQARQPIYTSSSRRWVNYAPHLEQLAKGIKPYLDSEDLAELKRLGITVGGLFG